MKKLIILFILVSILRTAACTFCSLHFEHVVIAIALGNIIFKCFCGYQFLRLVVSVFGEHFNEKEASFLLSNLKKLFTIIVLMGCILHCISLINKSYTASNIIKSIIESSVIFIIFIIIELLVDVVFCLRSPIENTSTKELLWKNLSEYFWSNNDKSDDKISTIQKGDFIGKHKLIEEILPSIEKPSSTLKFNTNSQKNRNIRISVLKKLDKSIRLPKKKKR